MLVLQAVFDFDIWGTHPAIFEGTHHGFWGIDAPTWPWHWHDALSYTKLTPELEDVPADKN